MSRNAQRRRVDLAQVSGPVGHTHHPSLQPRQVAVYRSRLLCVVAVERVVALEETLRRRRMRASWFMDDRDHLRLWEQDPVWVAQDRLRVHELLAGDDHAVRSQAG